MCCLIYKWMGLLRFLIYWECWKISIHISAGKMKKKWDILTKKLFVASTDSAMKTVNMLCCQFWDGIVKINYCPQINVIQKKFKLHLFYLTSCVSDWFIWIIRGDFMYFLFTKKSFFSFLLFKKKKKKKKRYIYIYIYIQRERDREREREREVTLSLLLWKKNILYEICFFQHMYHSKTTLKI